MIDAETRKPRDRVAAAQVVQTDDTLAFVFRQYVVCKHHTQFIAVNTRLRLLLTISSLPVKFNIVSTFK